jgi:hypothetical protein
MTMRTCPAHFRATFLEEPRRVQLSPGEKLYKFVSIPIDRARIMASPWWIREAVFEDLRVRARRLQKPVSDLARSRMAIKSEWNPGMDTVFIVVLAANVEGWEGRARSQPLSNYSGNAVFTGGERQLCVPSLGWHQIGQNYSGTLAH